jgi:large subunit ribosomal protein L22
MEIQAFAKSVRISPRKAKLVADSLKNLSAVQALEALFFLRKRGGTFLEKTLKSAIANASKNANLKKEDLLVKNIQILQGSSFKRMRPGSRGRAKPYKKRTSHIRITLEEKNVQKNDLKGEKNGTKS